MTIKERLHIHDLSLDGQELRKQLIDNFKAIEQEDDKLSKQLTQLNKRLDELMNGGGM